MTADLLDQLAAYGAHERATRPPIDLEAVTHGDARSAVSDEAASGDASVLRPGRSAQRRDRRLGTMFTAAAMVVAAVGLIAVLAAVRDGPPEVPAPGSSSDIPIELFRVDADAAAYWRLTALPEYDGDEFRLPSRRLERIEGVFPPGSAGEPLVRQRVQVLALDGRLVPAAVEPFQASGFSGAAEIGLSFDRDTSTLVASHDLRPGDLFTIVSKAPQPSSDDLRAAPTDAPDPLLVALPEDLPAVFSDLAVDVTDGAATSYDSAVALQHWLRMSFEHRDDVIDGHSIDDLDEFLVGRAGDAEQFSAAFALMARTLGLPTRVAVGFTPGVLNQDGWYSVTTAQSHSWPEVWFDDIGWIAFEPTPGLGIPDAEAVAGLSARQNDAPPTSSPVGAGPTAP